MPISLTTLPIRLVAALAIASLGAAFAGTASAGDAAKIDPIQTSATADATPPAPDGKVDIAKLMAPGPLPEISLGKADAKVTIVEYMSLDCPHCMRFATTVFEPIKKKYVDTGKVRFIVREFPLHSRAMAAIMLARCVPQDKFFPMITAMFQTQETWAVADDGRAALLQVAKLAGFTQETFEACLTNQKLLDDVTAIREKASNDFGVDSTPTFFVNGAKYTGEMTVDQMSAIIDAAG
jgi:protein-disulfide isomerase